MKNIIQKLAHTGDELYAKIGQVIRVDPKKATADIKPIDGSSEIFDVYISVENQKGGILILPEVGSLVCVVFISKEIAVLVNYSELEKYQVKIKQILFQIDQDGFSLKNNEVSFKELLNELLTELKNAVIQTPSGVGNFSAKNVMKFTEIENKVNQLFK